MTSPTQKASLATAANTANAALAASPGAAPTLTAPAAELLAPLPQNHHPHRAQPGLLSQWAHDVASWF